MVVQYTLIPRLLRPRLLLSSHVLVLIRYSIYSSNSFKIRISFICRLAVVCHCFIRTNQLRMNLSIYLTRAMLEKGVPRLPENFFWTKLSLLSRTHCSIVLPNFFLPSCNAIWWETQLSLDYFSIVEKIRQRHGSRRRLDQFKWFTFRL